MGLLTNSVFARAATASLQGILSLPDPALRFLGGPAIEVDGQRLAPTAQLFLRLQQFIPRTAAHLADDLMAFRREVDKAAAMLGAGVGRSVHTHDVEVRGGDGPLHARVYESATLPAVGPVLLYFHGGGFVLGSIESHDSVCRYLAEQAGVRVVSVDYRLTPEHPFPAAVEDATAAFADIAEHADQFGTAAGLIAVGGDSAGANLAAAVAHNAIRTGNTPPLLSLLLYPPTDITGDHVSHQLFGEGFLLDQETLLWYRDQYLPDVEHHVDPRVSLLRETQLSGLGPTWVFTAGFDPFRDEGRAYAAHLQRAGSVAHHRTYSGLLHGFANFVGPDREARTAMHEIAETLRDALVHPTGQPVRAAVGLCAA
jgi:acetyl esterase